MHNTRKIVEDLYWVGVDDRRLELFENIHPIPEGVSYNSYLLLDEKTVLFDTVDWAVCRDFLENIEYVLQGRSLDYLVIHHMEPDHCASLQEIILRYPEVKVISSEKGFMLMHQFGYDVDGREMEVKEGDSLSFGKHTIAFVEAPMVHWPEVLMSYDTTSKVLFAADAFGSFKSLDGRLFNDEVDYDRDWIESARRYYTNIVGKYGPHVQAVLKKAAGLDIQVICPLHGLVWRSNIEYLLDKYMHWSTYEPEEKGIMIVYASMYGNTENTANLLASTLVQKGFTNVRLYDVSKTHVSYLISEAFKYSHIVFASVTYNLGIYPPMHDFLMDLKALHVQKRTCAIIENGSWACTVGSLMKNELNEMKQMSLIHEELNMISSLHEKDLSDLDALADGLIASMDV